jgi:hypothetical protein
LVESDLDQRNLAAATEVTESGVVALAKRERIQEENRHMPKGTDARGSNQTKAKL